MELHLCKVEKSSLDDIAKATSWDWSYINGKRISHNSYNMSDAVNAYDWSRKISIGDVNTLGHFAALKKAIEVRKVLPKYDYNYFQAHSPFESSSVFNTWGAGSGKTSIGVRNNEYFCFIGGVVNESIGFGHSNIKSSIFCSNPAGAGYNTAGSDAIQLWWYTTVCVKF